jgi:DNA-binding CsgD family transcriptional regulator
MAPQKRRRVGGSLIRVPKTIAPVALDPLTPREGEVVRWIAAGKRNGEIAVILDLSPRTVQKHVQNILGKLSVETRTAACTWWHEQCREAERSRNGNGR